MRIVNLHHGGFVPTLRKLGHAVLSIGTTADCDIRLEHPLSHKRFLELLASRDFAPDLVLWFDACQPPWIFGLETLPAVVLGYSVDQYMHPWHVPYSAGFDAFFVAQKDYLPLFALPGLSRPCHWLPLFCSPDRDRDPGLDRDIPVSFVGTMGAPANPARKAFFDVFRTKVPLYAQKGLYAPIYGRSRLVLNQSAAGELNFRLFEAMACGATLLTEDVANGLRDLFTPGQDLLVYRRGDPADAAAQALAALANPDLPAIAASGRRKTLAQHTVTSRAHTILDAARQAMAVNLPGKRLANLARIRAEVTKALTFLATDDHLPLIASERQFFLNLTRCG
jgi:hypothetical protein